VSPDGALLGVPVNGVAWGDVFAGFGAGATYGCEVVFDRSGADEIFGTAHSWREPRIEKYQFRSRAYTDNAMSRC
jgi:hypothetical protein